MIELKTKRKLIYSPYLSVYKPQAANIISISDRITGLLIIISILILEFLEILSGLIDNYFIYFLTFSVECGNSFLINVVMEFISFIFIYHVTFLLVIIFKLKGFMGGDIYDYRYALFKKRDQQYVYFYILLNFVNLLI